MDRRTFLAGTGAVLLAAPLAAGTQQAGKMYRIAFLGSGSVSAQHYRGEALRGGLRDLGCLEGKNIAIEYRWTEGRSDPVRPRYGVYS